MPKTLAFIGLPLMVGLLASAWSHSKENSQEYSADISDVKSLLLGETYGQNIYLDQSLAASGNSDPLSSDQLRRLKAYVSELNKTLDVRDAASEISLINTRGHGEISSELHELIRACEYWRQKTSDRLSCRNGELKDYWASFKNSEALPDRREARRLARAAASAVVEIVDTKTITFPADVQWEFAEFGTAFVLDKLDQWIRASTNLSSFQLRSGETTIVRDAEDTDWHIALNRAFHSALESLDAGSVASPAFSQIIPWDRQLVAKRHMLGVIDSSTGWPEAKHASLTVSENAFSSRALALLGAIEDAQSLLERLDGMPESQLLLMAEDGRVQRSANIVSVGDAASVATRYRIAYEIPEIDADPYYRPYLSIWISDEKQQPLRNLLLLGDQERWMQELRVWWRRVGRRNQSVIDGLSGATRRPGQYDLVWDGRDDFGQPVEVQNLIIHVEASREDGGRSYERIPIDLALFPGEIRTEATDELGEIRIEFLNTDLVSAAQQ